MTKHKASATNAHEYLSEGIFSNTLMVAHNANSVESLANGIDAYLGIVLDKLSPSVK